MGNVLLARDLLRGPKMHRSESVIKNGSSTLAYRPKLCIFFRGKADPDKDSRLIAEV